MGLGMKKNIRNESFFELKENKNFKIIFFILLGSAAFGLFVVFRFFLWPLIFALILYVGLMPLQDRFLKKRIKNRTLSANILIFLFLLVVVFPFFILMISLFDQSYQFYQYLQIKINSGAIQRLENQYLVKSIMDFLNFTEADIIRKIIEIIQAKAMTLLSRVTSLIAYPITFTVNFFFMIIILFFLLKDGEKIERAFYRAIPFPEYLQKNIVGRLKEVIKVLLAGNMLIMILQGLMVGIGFYICGFTTFLLWGSIASILSLIPVVGTMLVWSPAVAYLAYTGAYGYAIFLGAWCLIWYLVLENLVKPKVFGEKLKFNPVVFFFLLLGSIQAFGLPGVIFGPVLLTLFYSLWEIYKILSETDKKNIN